MPALEYGITHCLDFHSVFVLQEFDLFSPLNIILEILYPETSEIEVVRITFINCVHVLTLLCPCIDSRNISHVQGHRAKATCLGRSHSERARAMQ